MQVEATSLDELRRRRARRAAAPSVVVPAPAPPAARVPDRALPHGAAQTYRTFPLGEVSRAGGEWHVDWERAHADAQRVLDSIDFSRRDIVVWVPGSDARGVHSDFEDAVRDFYAGTGAALVGLRYEASWNMRTSVPTGIATLRLVLEGIRARGGDHRVLLAGESQGAWVIGEAMADPAVSSVVDRAILMGHPWLAKHQYAEGQDPRVRVINHHGDQVTLPVKGDATVALDAMVAIRTLQLTRIGDVAKALAANPAHAVSLLGSLVFAVPVLKSLLQNPHDYGGDMTRAVEYLRHGDLPFSQAYVRAAGLATSPLLADPRHSDDEHQRLQRLAAVAAYAAQRAA